jgi:hypothetical protein
MSRKAMKTFILLSLISTAAMSAAPKPGTNYLSALLTEAS